MQESELEQSFSGAAIVAVSKPQTIHRGYIHITCTTRNPFTSGFVKGLDCASARACDQDVGFLIGDHDSATEAPMSVERREGDVGIQGVTG